MTIKAFQFRSGLDISEVENGEHVVKKLVQANTVLNIDREVTNQFLQFYYSVAD